jgi:hypothetical protein
MFTLPEREDDDVFGCQVIVTSPSPVPEAGDAESQLRFELAVQLHQLAAGSTAITLEPPGDSVVIEDEDSVTAPSEQSGPAACVTVITPPPT